ncbi:MAG TPA: hypothetical protein ENG83_03875 [Nitrospirae bacterium]|nr:hypothetical protein [Nitrospirota bacterium]HDZ02653.1 hypothetical protein [Nitrospirota bacterium]
MVCRKPGIPAVIDTGTDAQINFA